MQPSTRNLCLPAYHYARALKEIGIDPEMVFIRLVSALEVLSQDFPLTHGNDMFENYVGRSEMCQQFADLLNRALTYLQFPSRPVIGTAIYYAVNGNEIFRWTHAWVRVGNEAIDGNVDSLSENPCVPKEVSVAPYWGPIDQTPADRKLREKHGDLLPPDVDVEKLWWPDLRHWIDTNLLVRESIGGADGDT